MQRPQEIEDLSDEIKEVCALKESAISDQNFEDAAEARDKEKITASVNAFLNHGRKTGNKTEPK